MPGKPFQSKLEPHADFIRECRRKRWSYARIARAIGEQFGMKVSANTVFSFVKVRAKPIQMYEMLPREPDVSSAISAQSFFLKPSPQEKAAQEVKKPLWNLDPLL